MENNKVKIWWNVNIQSGIEEVSFEDLNIKDKDEWDALSSEERNEKLQEYLDNLPERTSIILESFIIK